MTSKRKKREKTVTKMSIDLQATPKSSKKEGKQNKRLTITKVTPVNKNEGMPFEIAQKDATKVSIKEGKHSSETPRAAHLATPSHKKKNIAFDIDQKHSINNTDCQKDAEK